MYKSRALLKTIVLILLCTTALAGCGIGSGANDGKKELTFMFRGGVDEQAAYREVVSKFEEDYPDVKVNIIVTTGDQYATKLKAAIAGNSQPDVFYIEPGDVRAFAIGNVLLDLTDYIPDDVDLNNIWKFGVDSYRFDGETIGQGAIYGLPKDVGPFSLGYNKTMFEEAGIPLPDKDKPYTWEEFVKVNQQLTIDKNGDGEPDQFGTGLNANWTLQAFVWSNGANWIDETQTKVTIDDPKFVEALQFFADMQNKYHITPSIEEAQTLDTYQRWLKGELAFFPVGPWDLSTFESLSFDYDLIPYPAGSTGKSATFVGTLGIGVSSRTEYPEEAAALVTYLTASREGQQALVDAKIQIPNLLDMAQDWANNDSLRPPNKKEFLDIVNEYGGPLPANFTYTSEWYDLFFTNIQPVLDGKITAEKWVKEQQPKMQKLLDRALMQEKSAKENNKK